ncbi:MAG: hypothetical protein ACOY94_13820, partial [Bacillota bacterium]
MSTHKGVAKRSPINLSAYYRQSLEAEQMLRLQVSLEQKGYALLRHHEDQLITRGAQTALLTDPSDLQQARQLIARAARAEQQSLFYAFPLVAQQRSLIPVCYTQVTAEPGPTPGTLLLRRDGDLLVNRRFLLEDGDLTDAEVAQFVRRLDQPGAALQELLGEGVITPQGMLFRADSDTMTRSLIRELEWLERQTQFSGPLLAYLADTPPAPTQAATPGVTVVRSNPAQDRVLRLRPSVLQVVAGPPGTGKTQTIINLIASA